MVAEIESGGIEYWQVWARNSSGYMSGDQSAPANDTTMHAILFKSITQTDLNIRDLVAQPIRGGDTIRGNMFYGTSGIDTFTVTHEGVDFDNVALAHGTAIDSTTNSEYDMGTLYTSGGDLLDIGMAFTSQAVVFGGTKKWLTFIIPHAQAQVRRVSAGFQANDTYVWRITPIVTDTSLHGTAFSSYNMSVTGSEMDHYFWLTDERVAFTTYVGDGVTTTFTTKYLPTSSTVTLNATPNWFSVAGTDTALSSIVTSTGVATMAAAGSAGAFNVLAYETRFILV